MGAGLKRAASAARRTNYPGTPEPKFGQVWEDCDKRLSASSGGARRVKIERTDEEFAYCKVVNGHSEGRSVKIRIDRFIPTSTGYRYVRTDP